MGDTTMMGNGTPSGQQTESWDLLFLIDATKSMRHFIDGLNKALPDLLKIAALTGSFERIGVMAYRDYHCKDITSWSGWCCSTDKMVDGLNTVDQKTVVERAANIMTQGDNDIPEATKTGLAYAYQEMRPDATTMIILYTDAPPHLKQVKDKNGEKERAVLLQKDSYSGTGYFFADWTSAAKVMRDGSKKANVYCILRADDVATSSPYQYLSEVTGGTVFKLSRVTSNAISILTTTMLLTWMGTDRRELQSEEGKLRVCIPSYVSTNKILNAASEDDPKLRKYVTTQASKVFSDNNQESHAILNELGSIMKQRGPPVGNFVERYNDDDKHKDVVIRQLRSIFEDNVVAMSLNPVFGNLWRAVCNGRGGEDRDVLAPIFGHHIERIQNYEDKVKMKKWLDESYDYTLTLEREIGEVAKEDRYPLVFLDPTATFAPGTTKSKRKEDYRDLHQFKRKELLEIGRSCDGKVLRRVGKVLTRLSIAESEADVPAHIRCSDGGILVRYVPISLMQPKYKRRFWKVLLHTVLSGTLLATRPAAVLAALSLRMGISTLRDAADAELLALGPIWNDVTTPENWAPGCIQLIIRADQDYEERVASGATIRPDPQQCILVDKDRTVFRTMLDYKLLEKYLQHPVDANISWHPTKTQVAAGPVATCRECLYPRSVTIMAENGICGLCCVSPTNCNCGACTRSPDHAQQLCTNVTKKDDENSSMAWVECCVETCRAQYVVYNTKKHGVRAKCFYCRHVGNMVTERTIESAPTVQCCQCLSKMIWPKEYRPKDFNEAAFTCPGCKTSVRTVVPLEITPHDIKEENGWTWLLKNADMTIASPFDGRSIFYTATHCDLSDFITKVELLPYAEDTIVTIKGKRVHNIAGIKESLRQRIKNRESAAFTCSLCFSKFKAAHLLSACGRSSCKQRICAGCTQSWYGMNRAGRIINLAALSCAFCRRLPGVKIARRHHVADLVNLAQAISEAGSWIYAWCRRCGSAKRYLERVCADGAPEPVTGW
ncbi:hypothetical protein QQS21_010278, partial [Conoideocrella luteorostrata]